MPESGLTYSTELEWRLAAHWAGYRRFETFRALPADEQAELIAVYRTQARMGAVVDAEALRRRS